MKINKQLVTLATFVYITCAEGALGAESDPLLDSQGASNKELSDVRGGYVAGNGLEILFGIDKILAVNGVPLTSDSLNFAFGADRWAASGSSGSTTRKIQNGANNSIDLTLLNTLRPESFTFIQNTMDQAVIRNTTKIDVSVTVLDLYRDLNLSSIMNRQLIDSLR